MLTRLWYLVEDSVDFGLDAAFKWPIYLVWVGFAFVAAVSQWSQMKASAKARFSPSVFWLGLVAIAPVAMLCLGAIFWESAGSDPYGHPAVIALFILISLQVLVSYALIWKYRSRQIISLIASGFGIIWGLGTFFVSGFSITGTWP